MTMRKAAAALLGAVVTVSLAACGEDGGSGGGGGDQPYIAIVSKGFQHQFWQAVKQGAEEEADKQGARVTFVGPPTEADVEEQINMLTNDIAKSPQALGFAALDSTAAEPLAELVGGKGKVAMVVHDQTSKSGTDRRDGFMDWMRQNAPGITVLAPQYGGGDQAESANITKSIISSNPAM